MLDHLQVVGKADEEESLKSVEMLVPLSFFMMVYGAVYSTAPVGAPCR